MDSLERHSLITILHHLIISIIKKGNVTPDDSYFFWFRYSYKHFLPRRFNVLPVNGDCRVS